MFNPNQHIDFIQKEIDKFKQLYTTQQQPQYPLQDQIQQIVQQELAKYMPQKVEQQFTQPQPLPQPIEQKPIVTDPIETLKAQVMDLLSAVLVPDDLQMLGNPELLRGIPLFLKSKKGRDAMALLFNEYRTYITGE